VTRSVKVVMQYDGDFVYVIPLYGTIVLEDHILHQ
jgi:hypothetical protein